MAGPTPKKNKDKSYWQPDLLQTIHANQLVMIGMLKTLLTKEAKMAVDLTALTAAVAANADVETKVEAMVSHLVDLLNAIPPSSDPVTQAALDGLSAALEDSTAKLAALVVADTRP